MFAVATMRMKSGQWIDAVVVYSRLVLSLCSFKNNHCLTINAISYIAFIICVGDWL